MVPSADPAIRHIQVVKINARPTVRLPRDRKLPGQVGAKFKHSTPLTKNAHRNATGRWKLKYRARDEERDGDKVRTKQLMRPTSTASNVHSRRR